MSLSDELRELSELHERGALTDAEFAAAKARVLGQGPELTAVRRPSLDGPSVTVDAALGVVGPLPQVGGATASADASEAGPDQQLRPESKRHRPIGLTVYASLNIALGTIGILLAVLSLLNDEVREYAGVLPFAWGAIMGAVLVGVSIAFLRGNRWSRTLLLSYTAVWLLDKLATWSDRLELRRALDLSGRGSPEIPMFVAMVLVLGWLLLPFVMSKWMSFLHAAPSDRGAVPPGSQTRLDPDAQSPRRTGSSSCAVFIVGTTGGMMLLWGLVQQSIGWGSWGVILLVIVLIERTDGAEPMSRSTREEKIRQAREPTEQDQTDRL